MEFINNYFVLIFIPLVYLATALLKPLIQKMVKINICAICLAVSLSWLVLLILWISGFAASETNLAILMGMSVSGIMYKMEIYFKEKTLRNFWFIRLIIIIGGYYTISALLNKNYNLLLLLLVGIFLTISVSIIFGKSNSKEEKNNKNSIYKKLENCC